MRQGKCSSVHAIACILIGLVDASEGHETSKMSVNAHGNSCSVGGSDGEVDEAAARAAVEELVSCNGIGACNSLCFTTVVHDWLHA